MWTGNPIYAPQSGGLIRLRRGFETTYMQKITTEFLGFSQVPESVRSLQNQSRANASILISQYVLGFLLITPSLRLLIAVFIRVIPWFVVTIDVLLRLLQYF